MLIPRGRDVVRASLFALALSVLTACGGGGDGTGIVIRPVTVTVSPTDLTVSQGASGVVAVVIAGGSPTPTLASCTSGATNIATATVSAGSCSVTGVAPGSTTVTARTSGGQSASANVTVTGLPAALTSVSVTPSPGTVQVGQTLALVPSAVTGGSGVTVTYAFSSSDTTRATVSSAGVVTGKAPGTVTITVQGTGTGPTFSNVTLTAQTQITVNAAPAAASNLVVTPTFSSISVAETRTLTPSVTTGGAGVTVAYSYTTTDASKASVTSGGVVTGVAVGNATITVTATASGAGFTTTTLTSTLPLSVVTQLGVGFGAEQFTTIAAGSNVRGSNNGNADETPVRTIFVSQFAIQRTEVTQGQWRQVMAGTALANPSGFGSCGDTCPVESVTWNDIQQFLTRLNAQDPGKNYRLPTEAEWEYAARAGTTGDLNVPSQPVEAQAWISTNSGGRTNKVAQRLPNAFGLYDMIGNVWEWVNDWYSATYYGAAPPVDPTGPSTGTERSLRGSSWFYNATLARTAVREKLVPTAKTDALGFRLARNP